MHPLAHFKTITKHRHIVCRYCFRLGLIWQGLTHDLSKYSPTEFWRGALKDYGEEAAFEYIRERLRTEPKIPEEPPLRKKELDL